MSTRSSNTRHSGVSDDQLQRPNSLAFTRRLARLAPLPLVSATSRPTLSSQQTNLAISSQYWHWPLFSAASRHPLATSHPTLASQHTNVAISSPNTVQSLSALVSIFLVRTRTWVSHQPRLLTPQPRPVNLQPLLPAPTFLLHHYSARVPGYTIPSILVEADDFPPASRQSRLPWAPPRIVSTPFSAVRDFPHTHYKSFYLKSYFHMVLPAPCGSSRHIRRARPHPLNVDFQGYLAQSSLFGYFPSYQAISHPI